MPTKKKTPKPLSNPEFAAAMREIGRSSATTRHSAKTVRKNRTRADRLRRAIRHEGN